MRRLTLDELHVLLVEPSATQQHVIGTCLNDLGIRDVRNERRGTEALAVMRREKPDLVISAMYLPDMTGTDLVSKMRVDDVLRDIAFMLVSSEQSIEALDPVRQAGVVAILPKPFELGQLKQALYTTLDFLEPEVLTLEAGFAEEIRVLIVDDSRTARRHIRKTLEGFGIEHIDEAADGKEGVALIDRSFYDLVVTDYNMPRMSGNELVGYIRNHSRQPAVPVLMVTSESDLSRLAAVDHTGVSALCDKPFEPAVVRDLIRKIL